MALLTGFINGLIRWDENPSTTKIIPFQSAIENVTLTYSGNLLTSKTFNSRGIKVATAGCLSEVEATIEFSSTNITFGLLQAAAATLFENNTTDDDVYVSIDAVPPAAGTITLPSTPLSGTVVVADADGVIYPGTVSGTTWTATVPANVAGRRVTASYARAGVTTEKVIRVGSGQPLPPVGVYGKFFSCEAGYTFMANRVIIVPNLNLTVGDNPAEIGFTGTILADETDTLFTLIKD